MGIGTVPSKVLTGGQQFLDPPSYMTSVELMNYGYLCSLCPTPHMFLGPLSSSRKNKKFSQYLPPKVIHRFKPLRPLIVERGGSFVVRRLSCERIVGRLFESRSSRQCV